MISTVLIWLGILLLFSATIFVHEAGHFLVAKALGLVADAFSIGMGPALWQKKIGETTYRIGCLPVGGYVALPQLDPNSFLEGPAAENGEKTTETAENAPRSLPPIAPWKKVAVALAGAAGNIVFAFVLGVIVWIAGKPCELAETNSVVGFVAREGGTAWERGIREGDAIAAVNGKAVANWEEIFAAVALSAGDEARLAVARGGETFEAVVALADSPLGVKCIPDLDGESLCLVAAVYPGSAASAAGLAPGDRVVSFGGVEPRSRSHLARLVDEAAGQETEIAFVRGGKTIVSRATPQYDPALERALIGITFNTRADLDFARKSHPTPWAQIKSHAGGIFRFLKALSTPKTAGAAAGAVGGPILIFAMFFTMLKLSFVMALWFTGFLNVNLAIMNLLPLPVLDGGQVVFGLIEMVRGKPLPREVTNRLTNAFAMLLIALFLLLSYRDTVRSVLPHFRRAAEPKPVIFTQDAEP
jgi:regulator of sigma E protease